MMHSSPSPVRRENAPLIFTISCTTENRSLFPFSSYFVPRNSSCIFSMSSCLTSSGTYPETYPHEEPSCHSAKSEKKLVPFILSGRSTERNHGTALPAV